MRLTVVGCSPAWPNPGSAHSGYLVEADGRRLLLDCGPGVLARLRAAGVWPAVDAVVVTHFHLDHSGDLVPWMYGHLMGPAQDAPAAAFFLPPEGHTWFETHRAQFEGTFAPTAYAEREPFDAAGLRVTPFRVPHYAQPTWALRVEHGGRTLAFSADTAPSPALVECARDADLFLCEATLADDAPDADPRGHLSAREAVAAAGEAGARRLVLVHRPAELAAPDGVEVARDGLVVEL